MPHEGVSQHCEIGLDLALSLLASVRSAAESTGIAVAGVVSDRAGNVVASMRMEGTALGAMTLALDKAYTAALWQTPTGAFMETTQPGGDDWAFNTTSGGRMVVYAGGLPAFVDGGLVGALGVSGGTAEQDERCARAALDAAGLD